MEMMIFRLCMFSLMKPSRNAEVGQLSGLFQPWNMQCFYGTDQKQKRNHGQIFSKVLAQAYFLIIMESRRLAET